MSDFILEILNEEVPARMQKNAAANLAKIAEEILVKNGLKLNSNQIKTFVTPLRLALCVSGLDEIQTTPAVKRVGPKTNADEKAIQGFLKSVGLSDKSQLQIIENNNQSCYSYTLHASEVKTSEILKISVLQILQKMLSAWPKLMRFDVLNEEGSIVQQAKWIRPIRNILCLFGDQLIDFEFAALKSCNRTLAGNHANQSLEVKNYQNYREILEKNCVILDQVERKRKIIDQINKLKTEQALETIDDLENSSLIDEVVGLCENPNALIGSIDQHFLKLPPEILILTLKLNQRYFCLKDQKGNLACQFIFINNINVDESNKEKLVKDNEKLVRARLSDAEFFINEDLKIPLSARVDLLKNISFHPKLGSVFDKVQRIKTLSKFLSHFVPHADLTLAEYSADLAKADLTTKAVAEFPELQGKIGCFYALKQQENPKVASAIEEHYLPLGPNSELPNTSLGIVLAIADKIDSIVGFFLANEKPTSSKDPYALRRSVLGIIRIGFEYNITFPIRILIEKSLNAYPTKLLKELLKRDDQEFLEAKKILIEEIITFFVERLKSYLKEHDSSQSEIINVVIADYLSDLESHKYCDILYLAKKITFLGEFIKEEKYQKILLLYKRSANILAAEEKKDGEKYEGKVSSLMLRDKYEKLLYKRIKQIKKPFKKLVIAGDFAGAFDLLHILELPLQHFFDNVTVNDKNNKLRQNRLLILSKIRFLFNQVADLSKVEI